MNRFRFPSLATAAAALATQMTFAPDANAVVVPVTDGSTLTGFDGIGVDGTLYDMTFVPVTDDAPTPVFTSLDSAHSASQALGDELFSYWQALGRSSSEVAAVPSLTDATSSRQTVQWRHSGPNCS